MDQTLDPILDASEGSEIHNVRYHALHDLPDLIRFLGNMPGIGLQAFQAQAYALPLAIDAQHIDLHLVPHIQHFAGMFHTSPRQFGDVDQAISTSKINERAKIAEVPDRPSEDVTFLKFVQQIRLPLLTPLTCSGALGQDEPTALTIHLYDLQRHLLAFHL